MRRENPKSAIEKLFDSGRQQEAIYYAVKALNLSVPDAKEYVENIIKQYVIERE